MLSRNEFIESLDCLRACTERLRDIRAELETVREDTLLNSINIVIDPSKEPVGRTQHGDDKIFNAVYKADTKYNSLVREIERLEEYREPFRRLFNEARERNVINSEEQLALECFYLSLALQDAIIKWMFKGDIHNVHAQRYKAIKKLYADYSASGSDFIPFAIYD